VKADQHEVTAAYVYRHTLNHFTPWVEAGFGSLVFKPTDEIQRREHSLETHWSMLHRISIWEHLSK
jgi:hypothetical protein